MDEQKKQQFETMMKRALGLPDKDELRLIWPEASGQFWHYMDRIFYLTEYQRDNLKSILDEPDEIFTLETGVTVHFYYLDSHTCDEIVLFFESVIKEMCQEYTKLKYGGLPAWVE